MKKLNSILFCAVAAFAVASCNKEAQEVSEAKSDLIPMTFTATTTETRTVLDEDHVSIKWLATDKISVFDGTANRVFTSNGEGTTVKFTGEAADFGNYLAVYPYNENIQFSATRAETTLADAQTPVNGTFADGLNINAALSADKSSFHFENVLSVAKFTLSASNLGGKTIKSVKFASTHPLAGDVSVRISPEGISASAGDNTVNEVTMTSESGLADGTYYFVVLPNAGGEITMTFESTDGYLARKTATLGKAFTAGSIKNLGSVKGLVWTKVFFYESFDQCQGKGGNDGLWSGNGVASSDLHPDNEGWVAESMNGANHCAKTGASSKSGAFTSPSFNATGDVSLTFMAAPWGTDGTDLVVSSSNSSVTVEGGNCTMVAGRFTQFDVTLKNMSGNSKITFTPDKRFFLDEVLVYVGDKNLALEIATGDLAETIPAPVFSPAAGTYSSAQTIAITAEGADQIFYGINANPTVEYTGPITISSSCTLKAYAVKGNKTSEVAEAVYIINIPGTVTAKYDFTTLNFSGWSQSYAQHIIQYTDATVTFEAASKQGGTMSITNQPVTKQGPVYVVLKSGTMSKVKFVCKQWTNKSKTITLNYSTDGGSNYSSTGITSTNFSIESESLPANTNAVSITFNNDNQVGITSVEFTYHQ